MSERVFVPLCPEEDALEEGMAVHSSILAWRIPMGRGGWGATVSPLGRPESDTSEATAHACMHVLRRKGVGSVRLAVSGTK